MAGVISQESYQKLTISKALESMLSGSLPVSIRGVNSSHILGANKVKVYKSPQADMGYDISDYKDIDPVYGTLADVDNLISKLKERGMRLIMDLVVNHTSEEVRCSRP